jgi:hypothetical protein
MYYAIATTVLRKVASVVIPIIPMFWNLNTNNWEAETRTWDTV